MLVEIIGFQTYPKRLNQEPHLEHTLYADVKGVHKSSPEFVERITPIKIYLDETPKCYEDYLKARIVYPDDLDRQIDKEQQEVFKILVWEQIYEGVILQGKRRERNRQNMAIQDVF